MVAIREFGPHSPQRLDQRFELRTAGFTVRKAVNPDAPDAVAVREVQKNEEAPKAAEYG